MTGFVFYYFLSLVYRFVFCVFFHIVCSFFNFQLPAKMLKSIFIEVTWREWPRRLIRCDQISRIPAQTTLGNWSGPVTHPR